MTREEKIEIEKRLIEEAKQIELETFRPLTGQEKRRERRKEKRGKK